MILLTIARFFFSRKSITSETKNRDPFQLGTIDFLIIYSIFQISKVKADCCSYVSHCLVLKVSFLSSLESTAFLLLWVRNLDSFLLSQ